MPCAQPKTFDAAVKHLFRHLHEYRRLRTNPIAAKLFAEWNVESSAAGQRRAVARLRLLVVKTNRDLYARGNRSSDGDRGERQYKLAELLYDEGRSIAEVARTLGISLKHCYRERAKISARIASAIVSAERAITAMTTGDEAFYFLLDQARELRSRSPHSALEAARLLEGATHTPHQRISAMQACGETLWDLGEPNAAEDEFDRARLLYQEQQALMPAAMRDVVTTNEGIIARHLAWRRGNWGAMSAAAVAAANSADACRSLELPYAQTLAAAAKYDFATSLWLRGDLGQAYETLEALALNCEGRAIEDSYRLQIDSSLWQLRSYLAGTKGNRFRAADRAEGLLTSYKRAGKLGLTGQAVDALVWLLECYVFAGEDERALGAARSAISLAKSSNDPVIRDKAKIDVGYRLLSTKHWRVGSAILPQHCVRDRLGVYFEALLCHAKSVTALRSGDFERALMLTTEAAVGPGVKGLHVRNGLVEAQALYRLGNLGGAREAAVCAVDRADRLGSTELMKEAYAVAASVVREKRYAYRALELQRILAA